MRKLLFKSVMSMWFLAMFCGTASVPGPAAAAEDQEWKLNFGGYLREHMSMNLQDHPETSENDQFTLQMLRSAVQVEGDAAKGDIRVHAVGRVVGEIKTDYLKSLEKIGAGGGDLMSQYNISDLRELFIDFKAHERVMLRIGKQQVVWGETDFFQAMDAVHGFDYTWRSFLEGENEDYRKPLILGNAIIQVPELNGSLQLLLRPGFDRDKDIGSTFDIFGGRWIVTPYGGVNFLNPAVFPYNLHHRDGDADDPTWGARWLGKVGDITYSLAYLRTLGPDPVFNPSYGPFNGIPTTPGAVGETIYLKNDRFGLTATGYSSIADAVFSTEIVYIKDQGYNFGTAASPIPGLDGVITKDTVSAMVRMDKNLNLTGILGTNAPSFFTVQIFDKWIPQFKQSDNVVDFAGFSAQRKEHNVVGTVVLALNYLSSRLNPQIAAGYDFTYGGSFLIPSVAVAFGDKWRLNAEADLFFPKSHNDTPGGDSSDTHLIGYFAHKNQLSVRLTRQF